MVGAWRAWLLVVALCSAVALAQTTTPVVPTPSLEARASIPEGRVQLLQEMVALFERYYWRADHMDWRAWGNDYRERVREADTRASFDLVMGDMVRRVADDHSQWLGLPGAPAAPQRVPDGSNFGVRAHYLPERGILIERVYAESSAAAAGLRRGDVLLQVDDVPLAGLSGWLEAERVWASATVRPGAALWVQRGGARVTLVWPAAGRWPGRPDAPYGVMLDASVGYLHIPTFQEPSVAEWVHAAVATLVAEGARSLVVDVRGNTGGRLLEAGLVAALFMEGSWALAVARDALAWRATVAFDASRDELLAQLEVDAGANLGQATLVAPTRFFGEVVVLVDATTASAAEVLAGSLLALGRAAVVGEVSAGNVEAVRLYTLSDGSRVLIAIAELQAADGTPLSDGVQPRLTLRASLEDLARGMDPPLAEALRRLGGLPFTPGRIF